MPRTAAATIAFMFLCGAAISAQAVKSGPPSPAKAGVAPKEPAVAQHGQGTIRGRAADHNARPLPNAPVRVRNIATMEIDTISTANERGEFNFVVQPEIPYMVEVTDHAGRVIAVSSVIVAHAGEVTTALVTVPARLPALASLLGDTAAAVISAATGVGMTALEPAPEPPASPEE